MGNNWSSRASAVGEAKGQYPFDDKEFQRLKRRFQRLVGDKSEATLQEFNTLPEIAGNPYLPRLVGLMDLDRNGTVSFSDFSASLAMYQELQKTQDGKLTLLFRIHDADSDGKLSRSELADLMRMSAGSSFDEDQLQGMVNLLMKVYDEDKDGALSRQELSRLVQACSESLTL